VVKLSSNSPDNKADGRRSEENCVYNDLMAHRDVVCLPQLRLGGGTLINEYDAIYSTRAAAATTAATITVTSQSSHCLPYWWLGGVVVRALDS